MDVILKQNIAAVLVKIVFCCHLHIKLKMFPHTHNTCTSNTYLHVKYVIKAKMWNENCNILVNNSLEHIFMYSE